MLRLYDQQYLTGSERDIILAALKDAPIPVNLEFKDIIRAHVLKNVILTILKYREEK